jgi:hypothetical protein
MTQTMTQTQIQEFMGIDAATAQDAASMMDVLEAHGFDLDCLDDEAVSEIPESEWLAMCDEAVAAQRAREEHK